MNQGVEHPSELRELAESIGTRRAYPAGTVMFLEGTPATEFFEIVHGRVKIVTYGIDGDEQIVDLLWPGDVVGDIPVLDAGTRSATAIAIGTTEVLAIRLDQFREELETNPTLYRSLGVVLAAKLRRTVRAHAQLTTLDGTGRLCARLVELYEREREITGPTATMSCPLSQAELGQWADLSREAVVKTLRTLRRLGWLTNHRSELVIHDITALRRRAGMATLRPADPVFPS